MENLPWCPEKPYVIYCIHAEEWVSAIMCRETPPPPPPPRYLFLSGALLLRLVGESHNHSLFFPFSPREGWRDGARAAASASHATQLQPLTPPPSSLLLLLLRTFFFLSCPSRHPPLTVLRSRPIVQRLPSWGPRTRGGRAGAEVGLGKMGVMDLELLWRMDMTGRVDLINFSLFPSGVDIFDYGLHEKCFSLCS